MTYPDTSIQPFNDSDSPKRRLTRYAPFKNLLALGDQSQKVLETIYEQERADLEPEKVARYLRDEIQFCADPVRREALSQKHAQLTDPKLQEALKRGAHMRVNEAIEAIRKIAFTVLDAGENFAEKELAIDLKSEQEFFARFGLPTNQPTALTNRWRVLLKTIRDHRAGIDSSGSRSALSLPSPTAYNSTFAIFAE